MADRAPVLLAAAFIVSPSALLLAMALVQRGIGYPSAGLAAVLLFAWVGVGCFVLRRLRFSPTFFGWSSVASALLLVLTPFASAALRIIHLGREEPFPAHLIMFPTVVLFILISLGILVVSLAGFVGRIFKGWTSR